MQKFENWVCQVWSLGCAKVKLFLVTAKQVTSCFFGGLDRTGQRASFFPE